MSGTLFVRSLPDQLVDLVRDRILNGRVGINMPIRQDAFAAELGVSKIPLREALARLEQEGLLQSHPNRGFTVKPLTAAEAREVYALRLKLEPELAAQAALCADSDQQQQAISILARLDEMTDALGAGTGAFNRAFHLALLRPANQPVTLGIIERLHVLSERYVRKHLEPLGRDERANAEHREMLAAWLSRDGARIAELTRAHTLATIHDLEQQLTDADTSADMARDREP